MCVALSSMPSTQKEKARMSDGGPEKAGNIRLHSHAGMRNLKLSGSGVLGRRSHEGLVVSFSFRVTLAAPWHVRRHPVSFTWLAS